MIVVVLLKILAFVLLFSTQNAVLAQMPTENLSYFFECETDEDCIVAYSSCPYQWTGVNKMHKHAYFENLQESLPYIRCMEGDPLAMEPSRAVCTNKKCKVFHNNQNEAVVTPEAFEEFFCKVDGDCAVVEAPCPGEWVSINTRFIESQKKLVDEMRPVIECMPENPSKVVPGTGVCIENKCAIHYWQ